MTAAVLSLPASHSSLARRRMESRAMDAALAQINKDFGPYFLHDRFKRQIRHFIRIGTGHPEARARYMMRAAALHGYSLDAAICITERWYRDERKAFQIASTFGFAHGRLSLQVLAELRVLLRWCRRSSYRDHLPGIIACVLDECDREETRA